MTILARILHVAERDPPELPHRRDVEGVDAHLEIADLGCVGDEPHVVCGRLDGPGERGEPLRLLLVLPLSMVTPE